jgi:hypothetical protein
MYDAIEYRGNRQADVEDLATAVDRSGRADGTRGGWLLDARGGRTEPVP